MSFFELIVMSFALAMDAFCVSVCKGLSVSKNKQVTALKCGAWFGSFQFLMPVLGWLLGTAFTHYVTRYTHWISFALLVFIGINMIREAVKGEEEDSGSLRIGEMLTLAVATSIDALAVGVTFALLEVDVITSCLCIGIITFFVCYTGVNIGAVIGERYNRVSKIIGGIVLAVLGVKILVEGLMR